MRLYIFFFSHSLSHLVVSKKNIENYQIHMIVYVYTSISSTGWVG